MKNIKSDEITAYLHKHAKRGVEKHLHDRIKLLFPDITRYTLNWNPIKQQAELTGLTPEQIDRVFNFDEKI